MREEIDSLEACDRFLVISPEYNLGEKYFFYCVPFFFPPNDFSNLLEGWRRFTSSSAKTNARLTVHRIIPDRVFRVRVLALPVRGREAMPQCGHLLLAVTIWSTFVASQKPSSATKRHDVYIAGFFPYTPIEFPEARIGRGVMPAVKLAVEHINDSPQVLRNYRLHMWWNDTQVSVINLKR